MLKFDSTLVDMLKFYVPLMLLLFSVVYGWITLYVIPHDRARAEIMECMGDRLWNEPLYSRCADIIQRTRDSP